MAKKTQRQKLATSRRDVRELREDHQTGLRRSVGNVIQNGTAYGGTRTVYEMMKMGMWTKGGFPMDMLITMPLQFLGDMRWLGAASDIVREFTGGHTGGRLGGMAAQHTFGIRYVNGQFVGGNGEPLPPKE